MADRLAQYRRGHADSGYGAAADLWDGPLDLAPGERVAILPPGHPRGTFHVATHPRMVEEGVVSAVLTTREGRRHTLWWRRADAGAAVDLDDDAGGPGAVGTIAVLRLRADRGVPLRIWHAEDAADPDVVENTRWV